MQNIHTRWNMGGINKILGFELSFGSVDFNGIGFFHRCYPTVFYYYSIEFFEFSCQTIYISCGVKAPLASDLYCLFEWNVYWNGVADGNFRAYFYEPFIYNIEFIHLFLILRKYISRYFLVTAIDSILTYISLYQFERLAS